MTHALTPPLTDPTPIFDLHRAHMGSELLIAASAHFKLFDHLAQGPRSFSELRKAVGLAERPAHVMFTALMALGILLERDGCIALSELAHEHLLSGGPFAIDDYIGLSADNPGVLAMVERLRANKPKGFDTDEGGDAFIFRKGKESAMDQEASARRLTMALASRARNVAPVLARRLNLEGVETLLDVGGGSGLYGIACLKQNPQLKLIVWDRPEVLKVVHELASAHGVAERTSCVGGDMFADPVPHADCVLLSNVLHDWDVPECQVLLNRLVAELPSGGRVLIVDALLNDTLDGPLGVALFSALLFTITEGRNYSTAEYRAMLQKSGLITTSEVIPTLIYCGVVEGVKP